MKAYVVTVINDPMSDEPSYVMGVFSTMDEAEEEVDDYINTHDVIICHTNIESCGAQYTLYYARDEENYDIVIEEKEIDEQDIN